MSHCGTWTAGASGGVALLGFEAPAEVNNGVTAMKDARRGTTQLRIWTDRCSAVREIAVAQQSTMHGSKPHMLEPAVSALACCVFVCVLYSIWPLQRPACPTWVDISFHLPWP